MLTIRLSRIGKKNSPSFRLIVQEKAKSPSSDVLEIIGHYNPRRDPAVFEVKTDRVTYWMSKGAQLSGTVHNLLINKGIITGEKRKVANVKKAKAEEQPAAAPATPPAAPPAAPAA